MKRIAVLVLLAVACAGTAISDTTVLVVRHAEKMANAGTDPDISPEGVARAKALAAVAEHAGVGAAYVTQYKRTKQTAEALHVPLIEVGVNLNAPAEYPKALAEAIRAKSAGKVVLVVSHSNTIPAVIETLAHVKVPPIADDEYDRLYIVTLPQSGPPRVIAAQYGHQSAR